jgi:hypothetical protein
MQMPAEVTSNGNARRGDPQAAPSSVWQKLKNVVVKTETEYSFFKGITFLGVLGTIIGAYFQYISAYNEKVTALAAEDLAQATAAFTDASKQLSVPLSLQERLVFSFFAANDPKTDKDEKAYIAANASKLIAQYDAAYAELRQGINLMAQRMEIFLDWPSDTNRDPAHPGSPAADPINSSMLGDVGFECDMQMPSFDPGKSRISLKNADDGAQLVVDWYSAKHNVYTIYFCFDLIHKQMRPARQWAAASDRAAPTDMQGFMAQKEALEGRMTRQVVRLNTFMNVAMLEIEQIRVKYRPRGPYCNVPVVREVIGLFSRRCTPVRVAEG